MGATTVKSGADCGPNWDRSRPWLPLSAAAASCASAAAMTSSIAMRREGVDIAVQALRATSSGGIKVRCR